MASFTVRFTSDQPVAAPVDTSTSAATSTSAVTSVEIECDGYAQEGTMLTFFTYGNDCDTIDAWSRRIASYRIADVASVVRGREPFGRVGSIEDIPVLVAC